jgi:hypothetical protein
VGTDIRALLGVARDNTVLLRAVLEELQTARQNAGETMKPIVEGREMLIEAVRVGNENKDELVAVLERLSNALESDGKKK